ncbi:MAG TPA: preprotein translocase subunit SecA [Candidatus Kapabacteria bacterium]|nr:preprotein translocase subunit SecA [Candidatus Kapabacteria bacterium]
MLKMLEKFFGSKRRKDVEALYPIVDDINELFEEYRSLSDDGLRGKTEEFRNRIRERVAEDQARLDELTEQLKEDIESEERDAILDEITDLEQAIYDGTEETLNEILPEAYAAVKEACRRHVGEQWEAGGSIITWTEVHYDVQLVGGTVLHQGKIAEMATGEGKTLTATLATYLNALSGRGVHIITVNDYLAKRDSEWMGPIYKWLGLTVGCIQANQPPHLRKAQYDCDITFGTNNEFGFDYLRDNMVQRPEDMVQRGHNYAIVDEVDSVLIDEARTPLIISGPVGQADDQNFDQMKPRVERLVQLQTREVAAMLAEAERLLETNDKSGRAQAGVAMLRAHRGVPRSKRLAKFLQEAGNKKLLQDTELEYLRDKGSRMQEIDNELYFSIDEKNHSIDLTDKGRQAIAASGEDPDIFLIPDLAAEMSQIEGSEMPQEEKVARRDEAMRRFADRSDRIHTISQLLRAYSLYEKDVEYVVDAGKIKIVDTFTGRILEGRRYSEGLHQAIEAKEGVVVQEDTQTLATITIQNYFRLYKKLAGMTGTAETEEGEFNQIYKLDVVVIPTNRDVVRDDMNDLIYRTKRAKYNAVVQEIEKMRTIGRPVLVGTTSVEVSETISRMLQRSKIPHSVLNAKQHAREAEIVAAAGQKGAVTIATNMAGRGTDIKLGPGVKDIGGLHILGTERHEARRIDRQLRGRAGRQGDPGSSQFFISLEDDLMRLFGGERITSLMEKIGAADEVLEHPMLNKSVERAQKKVEENNFAIRKRLLEFDNVMNQQREVIYDRRRHALHGERLKSEIFDYVDEFVGGLVTACYPEDIPLLQNEVRTKLLVDIVVDRERAEELGEADLKERILEAAKDFYARKEAQFGSDFMGNLERYAVLNVIDERWRQHLRDMDDLREGIYLRQYGQRDPIVEYKREAFEVFSRMINEIDVEVMSFAFKYFPESRAPRQGGEVTPRKQSGGGTRERSSSNTSSTRRLRFSHATTAGMGMTGDAEAAALAGASAKDADAEGAASRTVVRENPKIGRNDPCYCGSGKKFKHCHGRNG